MSDYDEKIHAVVTEKINRIEADWIAGRLNAESMESLLLYARAGVDIAVAGRKIAEVSRAVVEEMEVKSFRNELETTEKVEAVKASTAVVLEKLAEDFDEWAGNVDFNNRHTKRADWEGRAKGFREAAAEVRRRQRGLRG